MRPYVQHLAFNTFIIGQICFGAIEALAQESLGQEALKSDFQELATAQLQKGGLGLPPDALEQFDGIISEGVERLLEAGATPENIARSQESLRQLIVALEERAKYTAYQTLSIPVRDLVGRQVLLIDEEIGEIEKFVRKEGEVLAVLKGGGVIGPEDSYLVPTDLIALRGDEVRLRRVTEDALDDFPKYADGNEILTGYDLVQVGREQWTLAMVSFCPPPQLWPFCID